MKRSTKRNPIYFIRRDLSFLSFFFLFLLTYSTNLQSQDCPDGSDFLTLNDDGSGGSYPIDDDLTDNTLDPFPLTVYEGFMKFDFTLFGTADWANGIQIQNDVDAGGDFIYLQPDGTSGGGNHVEARLTFPTPVTNFNLSIGGLNNEDSYVIFPSYQGNPIPVGPNFTLIPEAGSGVVIYGNEARGEGTNGGTDPAINFVDLFVTGPVDSIAFIITKASGNNSTVTSSCLLYTSDAADE